MWFPDFKSGSEYAIWSLPFDAKNDREQNDVVYSHFRGRKIFRWPTIVGNIVYLEN